MCIDSLSPDKKYVTAFLSAGISNQIIATIHLLQLATRTGRVPILPPFSPIHVSLLAGFIPFSEVFDVVRLEKALGTEILEWGGAPSPTEEHNLISSSIPRKIKDTTGVDFDTESRTQAYLNLSRNKEFSMNPGYFKEFFLGSPDTLGCWSLAMAQSPRGNGPRHGDIPDALSLAVSWTPIPFGHQATPRSIVIDLDFLGSLGEPEVREESLKEVKSGYMKRVEEVRSGMDEQARNSLPVFAKEIPTSSTMRVSNRKKLDEIEDEGTKVGLGKQFDPEEHVLCFDYLFYSGFNNVGPSPSTNEGFLIVLSLLASIVRSRHRHN
jgi:hypothetical protein